MHDIDLVFNRLQTGRDNNMSFFIPTWVFSHGHFDFNFPVIFDETLKMNILKVFFVFPFKSDHKTSRINTVRWY